jgi:hypothetical protein
MREAPQKFSHFLGLLSSFKSHGRLEKHSTLSQQFRVWLETHARLIGLTIVLTYEAAGN